MAQSVNVDYLQQNVLCVGWVLNEDFCEEIAPNVDYMQQNMLDVCLGIEWKCRLSVAECAWCRQGIEWGFM